MTETPEQNLMSRVDVVPWEATETDEDEVLASLFSYETSTGTYYLRVGSKAPNTVAAVLNEAQKWVGVTGRPNTFTREYASRHGDAFLRAAWCDMFVTYVSRHAPAPSMLPKGDRAYTVWHAEDFQKIGRLKTGTTENLRKYAKPGAIVFFDWDLSNVVSRVDHVGIVVRQLADGRVVTVEGNTSDRCALRVRSSSVIASIATPAYSSEDKPKPEPAPAKPVTYQPARWPYKATTLMRKGWMDSAGVEKVQRRINVLGYRPALTADGDFGAKTEAAVKWVQRRYGLSVDGIVGPITWKWLFGGRA